MATIRPNAEPAATTVQVGDVFLIDGATGVRALAASSVAQTNAAQTFTGIQTFPAGSVSTPGVTVGSAGYGMYQPAANQIAITVNGFKEIDYGVTTPTTWTLGANTVIIGSILSKFATGGIGYATGAGGAVTQGTSKSTGVTLNTVSGAITMNAAALAAAAKVSFVVTDSAVAATDTPIVAVASGGTANAYRAAVTAVAAGSFTITVENITAGSLSEAPVVNFNILKGVAA